MQSRKYVRNLQNFFLGDGFFNGLKTTLGCLIPAMVLVFLGMPRQAVILAFGALTVSIVDFPGPFELRLRAMLIALCASVTLSALTACLNVSVPAILLLLALSSFIFSMLVVYGSRPAAIGTAILLSQFAQIGQPQTFSQIASHALFNCAGGLIYIFLSTVLYNISPYLEARQALANSITSVAGYLRIKAGFYMPQANLAHQYHQLVKQQSVVHEKQESVRDLLFQARRAVRDSTMQSRLLVVVFIDTVDLFEHIMATSFNYEELHNRYGNHKILRQYNTLINYMAAQLEHIAFEIRQRKVYPFEKNLSLLLANINETVAGMKTADQGFKEARGLVHLRSINKNLNAIAQRIDTIHQYLYYRQQSQLPRHNIQNTHRFVSIQSLSLKIFTGNLSLRSDGFRHALRFTITVLGGFLLTKALGSSHAYWVLLTILVILKPGYSITKKRNLNRVYGTLLGAAAAIVTLQVITNNYALFFLVFAAMLFAYSFIRTNYLVGVTFVTYVVLLVYHMQGVQGYSIISERVIDTLIGAGLALAAPLFILPTWEIDQSRANVVALLTANKLFIEFVLQVQNPEAESAEEYKLRRKNVFIATANMAAQLQRMLSEPESKKLVIKALHQFTVLNHLLSSHIVSLHQSLHAGSFNLATANNLQALPHALQVSLDVVAANNPVENISEVLPQAEVQFSTQPGVQSQIQVLYKLCLDVAKSTCRLVPLP